MVDKVLENRLRRMADRQGMILQKSPRRDPKAKDFGRYRLLVDHRDLVHHAQTTPFGMTFEEVRQRLESAED